MSAKTGLTGGVSLFAMESNSSIRSLSLRNETESWLNAMEEANAAIDILGVSTVSRFENEIDHYISKGWCEQGWTRSSIRSSGSYLSGQIVPSPFYQNAARKPFFQAVVFSDLPWVPAD